MYHDLTGSFPFMSLDGSVCFFILYHYETNSILATPIAGLDDKIIFKAYKTRFRELEAKGFKPKLNIMDNQATNILNNFSPRTNASSNWWNRTITGRFVRKRYQCEQRI